MATGESRRLAAVMFTDIVGYTALTQLNEARALELLRRHNDLLRPLFARYRGREIKTIGDSFLVEFESALDATECAVEIQRFLRQNNAIHSPEDRVRIRVGIHLGDVVRSGSDVFGDSVNIASRIEPLAEPEGVCVSGPVYEQVRNQVPYSFEKLDSVALKNVRSPPLVYRLILPWDGTSAANPSPDRDRLAVLPFVNISPDPRDEYLADGMTEELIGRLSGIRGLKVIARTSVMSYKRKDARLSQIGQELAVGSVVEGSVRRAGNRIRVAVQLVDARTEQHLWAAHYDKDLDDVFALQTDVASNVAHSLSQELLRRPSDDETSSSEAYALYLKAMQLYHQGEERDVRDGIARLEKAIELDPSFGRAFAGLSQGWMMLANFGVAAWSVITEKAEPAARRAVELSPESAEAHVAKALVHMHQDEYGAAIEEVRAALRLNPNLAEAHTTLGVLQCAPATLEESLSALRRAYELDPLSVPAAIRYAWMLQLRGHDRPALEVLERISQVRPSNAEVIDGFAEYYLLRKEWSRAGATLEAGLREHPHDTQLLADRARLLALTGHAESARKALEAIEHETEEVIYRSAQLYVLAALEDLDGAFSALTRLADFHAWPFVLTIHPLFANLRRDPRYLEFRARLHLPAT